MSTVTVEKQIGNYLSLLTASQKKTVLTVVKTIATAHDEYGDIWQDKAFAKEMDNRTKEYESGKTKLLKFEDMKTTAIAVYKAKKIRKR
jgi:tryptophan synthase beta subunit